LLTAVQKRTRSVSTIIVDLPARSFIFHRQGSSAEKTSREELKMLVLSRQRDETIVIGDNIRITIVDVRGDKVRIGIDAPRDVSVHREEVYNAIQRESEGAPSGAAGKAG